MTIGITHPFVSAIPDGADATVVRPSNWNASHSITGLGTGVEAALGINTGSAGSVVLFNGALGTPSSGTATNLTGLPIGGLTGLGTGVGTALAVNVGSAGAFVTFNGAGGTPSSLTLTNATGLVTAGLVNDAVTYAKMQNVSATARLIGRVTAGAGDPEEIPLGTGLAFSGGALVNTVTPTGGTVNVEDDGAAEGAADTIDFTGAGVSVTFAAGKASVAIPGGGTSDIIFADAPNQDFDIASVSPVTIISKSVTGIAAKDSIVVDIYYTTVNNSGAARNYTHAAAIGSLSAAAQETNINAGTGRVLRHACIQFSVSATNLAFALFAQLAFGATGVAADTTLAQSSGNSLGHWDSSTSDLTGTQTISWTVTSTSATATQTLTLHSYVIRKVSQL